VTLDRTSMTSLSIAVALHALLAFGLARWSLNRHQPSEMPLLIEVTLSGSSAPRSVSEGVKNRGAVVGAVKENPEEETGMTEAELKVWKAKRRRQIMRELASTGNPLLTNANPKAMRKKQEELATGRGAGDWGSPGSPTGTLSLSGAIASRGYKEPDFSVLKKMITEETQLKITVVVLPGGEVKKALLYETSGYPYVDQKALELSSKIVFDPLPSDWKQVEQQGVLTIKLKL